MHYTGTYILSRVLEHVITTCFKITIPTYSTMDTRAYGLETDHVRPAVSTSVQNHSNQVRRALAKYQHAVFHSL